MKRILMAFLSIIILIPMATSFAGVCGDVDNSGTVNTLDVTHLIDFLYKHGPAPQITSQPKDPVTDIDGNVYQTVAIGSTADVNHSGSMNILDILFLINNLYKGGLAPNCSEGQVWMVENLKVTHYRNGDSIPNVTDNAAWWALTTGAYCEYNNNISSVATYGRLYNWYAVSDSRNIAPTGWHVPTDAEWKQLEMTLGMSQAQADSIGWSGTTEGGKLKEAGTTHWLTPNTGATNESGFSALPGGYRYYNYGTYMDTGNYAYFWSSTEYSNYAWYRTLLYYSSALHRNLNYKEDGFSVRCVKD